MSSWFKHDTKDPSPWSDNPLPPIPPNPQSPHTEPDDIPFIIEEGLSIPQRMMSASVGSILTGFILTPFDVIRIRMQQQKILPDSLPCCAEKIKDSPASRTINTTKSLTNVKSTPLPKSKSHLFWLDKEYCRTVNNCSKIDSTFQGFKIISKHEGLRTLWRGMSINLIMAIPANVVYFTGYEYVRDHSPIQGHPINSLICGSVARLFAATSIAPLELIKTRLQSIPSGIGSSTAEVSKTLITDLFHQTKSSGLRSLFTGLSITLWRDVPFSGIYWSLYESLKLNIGNFLNTDFNVSTNENNWKVFVTSFISGSFSGSVAAMITHPFDVGKTRLQISEPDNGGGNKMFRYMFDIYKNEGWKALFGGLGPRVLKVAPSCAIMISSYEITKQFFKS